MPTPREYRRRSRSPGPRERRCRSRSPERTSLRVYRDRSHSPRHSTLPSLSKENQDTKYTRGRCDSYRPQEEPRRTSRRQSSLSDKENKSYTSIHHYICSSVREERNFTSRPNNLKVDSYRPSKELFDAARHNFTLPSKVSIKKLSETRPSCSRVTKKRVNNYYNRTSTVSKATVSNPKLSTDKIAKRVKSSKAKVPFKRADPVYVPPHPDLPLPSIEDPTVIPIDRTQPKNFENMPLTCYFWKVNGKCKHADEECPYAHWDTGYYAVAPVVGSADVETKMNELLEKESELKAREEALAKKEANACLCEECGKKLAGEKA